jgi:hypothetical protein
MMMLRAAGKAAAFETNVECATENWVRFDVAAQQLSACAWLMARLERARSRSDLCIGQLVPLMQHAIRASAVGCQPAQTERFPKHNVETIAIAANRRTSVIALRRIRNC